MLDSMLFSSVCSWVYKNGVFLHVASGASLFHSLLRFKIHHVL